MLVSDRTADVEHESKHMKEILDDIRLAVADKATLLVVSTAGPGKGLSQHGRQTRSLGSKHGTSERCLD